MQLLGCHGDGLPFGFPLDAGDWGKCVLCILCPLPLPGDGGGGNLGVGERPLPAVAASLISLGQLSAVGAAEKTGGQTEGHRAGESCSRRKAGGGGGDGGQCTLSWKDRGRGVG